jgi:CRISPR-associated protein Csx3
VFAIRHGGTLINQFKPGPAENGYFRLIVRWRAPDGSSGWSNLAGMGVAHRTRGPGAIEWTHLAAPGLSCRATLTVHPEKSAWAWRINLSNTSVVRLRVDILMAQDLGLADEAAVRNNEAFTSQYIDLLPVKDRSMGWILLARQNQPAAGGFHPWLAFGCTGRAAAFALMRGSFLVPTTD